MKQRGFTLLELAVVTAIVGLLSLILLPSVAEQIEAMRMAAEDAQMDHLAKLMERSFQSTEPATNVSSISRHPLGRESSWNTDFGADAVPANLAATWFAKLAALEGVAPRMGELALQDQPALWRVAANGVDRRRLLILGPEEPGQQRYLLLSLLAPLSAPLVIPENDGSVEWFDALWNHEWEGRGAAIPEDWLGRLTPDQVNAWMDGRGNSTRVGLLRVRRIVQPKLRLIVNNTHPLYTAWVDYEGVQAQLTSAPGSGVLTSPEILAGRLVVVRRGLAAPGAEACRFYIHEPTSVTVQP